MEIIFLVESGGLAENEWNVFVSLPS